MQRRPYETPVFPKPLERTPVISITADKTALPDFSFRHYLEDETSGRRRVVDAAAALFRDRGFAAVSMSEVAQAVGLSKPGLYHHWPSKHALLHTIVRLSGEALLDHLDAVEHEATDPGLRLKLYTLSRLEVITRHQALFTVTWQERAIVDTAAFGELTRVAERYRQRVRAMIDSAKAAGAVKPDVDTHLLMLALDGMTGWAYFWYRPGGDRDVAAIGEAFWSMLSEGVSPTPPQSS